jgi:hypothetical protein
MSQWALASKSFSKDGKIFKDLEQNAKLSLEEVKKFYDTLPED